MLLWLKTKLASNYATSDLTFIMRQALNKTYPRRARFSRPSGVCYYKRFLLYIPFVEGGAVAARVGLMARIVGGEVVIAREVFSGAHIDEIMRGGVEYGFETRAFDNAYRTGRKAGVAVGVIWRIDREVFVVKTPQREVADSELDCRVGLKFHAFGEAV